MTFQKIESSVTHTLFYLVVLLLLIRSLATDKKECVQRLEGACKVINIIEADKTLHYDVRQFHRPPPDGYHFKTTIEIIHRTNMYHYEKCINDEIKRRVTYNNKFIPVIVGIVIDTTKGPGLLAMELGRKNDRAVKFYYWKDTDDIVEEWNTFTPILPRFPYHLRVELTTSGTFLVYAQGSDEPFIQFQFVDEIVNRVTEIIFSKKSNDGHNDDEELIALFDYSSIGAPNCGSHRIDTLYDCRESVVKEGLAIFMHSLAKPKEGKIFDEYFVVDLTSKPMIGFIYDSSLIHIHFHSNGIVVYVIENGDRVKTVKTRKWENEIPNGMYAVRVQVFEGNFFPHLYISNIRGDKILNMTICSKGSLDEFGLQFVFKTEKNSKIYFDCMHPHNYSLKAHRDVKYNETLRIEVIFNELGYNFTIEVFDIRNYVEEDVPTVLYEDGYGYISTEDWCNGDPMPELYKENVGEEEILDIRTINRAILSQFQSHNNASAAGFKAIVAELQELRSQNKAIVSELQSIRESIRSQNKNNK